MTTKTSDLSDLLRNGVEEARERIEETQERLAEAAKAAKEKGEETWDDFSKYVRKNPGKTVAFSVGLGMLIGLLLNRPSSRD